MVLQLPQKHYSILKAINKKNEIFKNKYKHLNTLYTFAMYCWSMEKSVDGFGRWAGNLPGKFERFLEDIREGNRWEIRVVSVPYSGEIPGKNSADFGKVFWEKFPGKVRMIFVKLWQVIPGKIRAVSGRYSGGKSLGN